MNIQQIIAFSKGNMTTIILAVVAAALVAALILTASGRKSNRTNKALSTNERRFRNVFAMMSEDRQQSLISYYSQKYECGREEAMQRAIEDRARDEGRW